MEFRQLRYFIGVAETLSFTKAGQRLHIAQPALSRQIRQLEEEIGCSDRPVLPTHPPRLEYRGRSADHFFVWSVSNVPNLNGS